jgi:hypothetical protein
MVRAPLQALHGDAEARHCRYCCQRLRELNDLGAYELRILRGIQLSRKAQARVADPSHTIVNRKALLELIEREKQSTNRAVARFLPGRARVGIGCEVENPNPCFERR